MNNEGWVWVKLGSRVRFRMWVRFRVRDENYRSDPLRSLPKSLTPERKVVEL